MALVSDIEIRLRADIARLQNDMTQARRSVDGAMRDITQAAQRAKLALGGLVAGVGLGGLTRMVDEYAKFTAQLKLATTSQREYNAAYDDVKRIAAQSTQGLQQTGVLYARIANGTRQLGTTQKQVAAITETVNLALTVSGATAEEAASAQLQLSQAFASGTLRGEEFNAVNEAAPRLMLALADGIGVPVGALKKMAEQGEITSDIMARVLPNALGRLREEVKEIQTISGAFTVLRNQVLEFVGVQAQANGVVAATTSALTVLADNLALIAGAAITLTVAKLAGWFARIGGEAVTAAAANRAFLASNLAVAESEAAATAQASLLANARLAEVRAATLAATGNVQLALTTNALIPAQARATLATVAHDAAMAKLLITQRAAAISTAALTATMRALNGIVALTGGPIGFLITVLGGAALAFSHYGDKAREAAEKAKVAVDKSTQEIVDGLDKQNEKLRERIELSKQAGKADAAREGGEAAERLAALGAKINNDLAAINVGLYGPYKDEGTARLRIVELQYEYTQLADAISRVGAAQGELTNGSRAEQIKQWFGANGNATQKMEAELEELRKKFGEIPPEIEKVVRSKYAEKLDKDTKKLVESYAAFSKSVDQRIAETAREAAGIEPLNEAQKLELDLKEKLADKTLVLNAAQEAGLRTRIAQIQTNIVSTESQAAYKKMLEESGKLEQEMNKTRADALKNAQDEVETQEKLALVVGKTRMQLEQLELARLKEQLAQRSSLALTLYEIEDLEKLIALKERSVDAIARTEELEKVKDFWESIEKTAHDTFVSIADGGKNAFQRLKDTAKNIFFDWLYQQTLKKWIINIQANTSGTGGISDLFSGGAGGTNWMNVGKSIFDGFENGFSTIGTTAGKYVSQLGEMFGSNSAYSFGQGMQGFTAGGTGSGISGGAAGAGATASTVASAAGAFALAATIGKSLGNAISQGYATNITSSKALVNWSTLLSPVPILGGLAGGLINRAFGRKEKKFDDTVLNGLLGGGAFNGSFDTAWKQKGGWFHSDRSGVEKTAVGAEVSTALRDTYGAIIAATSDYAKILGLNADSLTSRNQAVALKLGKDEAENQKIIAEFFAGVADTVAVETLPQLTKFQAAGETAAATLQRLAVDFQVVEGVLTTFNTTSQTAFRAVGIASLEARERLIALAGGVDALASQTQFFADNFLSRAEQVAPLQKQVNDQLAALGYAGVATADQFKMAVQNLVYSGALATEQGAKTYAALMQLAPGFKTVADYLAEVNEAAKQVLRDRADAAVETLGRSVDAQKDVVTKAYNAAMDALGVRADALNETIERTTSLSQALKGALQGVDTPASQAAARQAAQAQIGAALAIAKAGGVLPSVDDLRDALTTLQGDNSNQFSTLAAYQRETARTNNQLIELGGLTDDQLSIAERQLRAINEQRESSKAAYELEIGRLDTLVLEAQRQLDAVNGVNISVLSVTAAVDAARFAIEALRTPNTRPDLGPPVMYSPPVVTAIPTPNYVASSGTMGGSQQAMINALQNMDTRLANMEASANRTANATVQFAGQFDQVSEGGNALRQVAA